jgi:hypothetical protein
VLEAARRIAAVDAGREVWLVVVKLEEAFMWAERIESRDLESSE